MGKDEDISYLETSEAHIYEERYSWTCPVCGEENLGAVYPLRFVDARGDVPNDTTRPETCAGCNTQVAVTIEFIS